MFSFEGRGPINKNTLKKSQLLVKMLERIEPSWHSYYKQYK
jgi:hypothetical protein